MCNAFRKLLTVGAILACLACDNLPPRRVIVRAGRLVDGSGAAAAGPTRLLIEDGTIVGIMPDDTTPLPEGYTVVDATGLTVLPGLVDAHTHLLAGGACTPGVGVGVLQAWRNLQGLVAAGVTTAADLASPTAVALGLRRYVGTARHRGPRLLVAGPMLTAAGGYLTGIQNGQLVDFGVVQPLADPAEARRVVQDLVDRGVDLIKIAVQEHDYNGAPLPPLDEATLCAAVDETHRQHLRIVAHAVSRLGYERALACGVDALVHGLADPMPDALLADLVAKKTLVVPTLLVFDAPLWGPKHLERLQTLAMARILTDNIRADLEAYAHADSQSGDVLPPTFLPNIKRADSVAFTQRLTDNARRMWQAHVPFGYGSDAANCFNPVGDPVEELERLQSLGMTPLEVLSIATYGGARVLDLHDALGKLVVGYRADLIAVAGAPDQHLDALHNVRLVMIDGVLQNLAPRWYQPLIAFWEIGRAFLVTS